MGSAFYGLLDTFMCVPSHLGVSRLQGGASRLSQPLPSAGTSINKAWGKSILEVQGRMCELTLVNLKHVTPFSLFLNNLSKFATVFELLHFEVFVFLGYELLGCPALPWVNWIVYNPFSRDCYGIMLDTQYLCLVSIMTHNAFAMYQG